MILLISNRELRYLFSHISCQLPEERKLDLLKALAEISPYSTPQDSRQILPSVVQLLKVIHSFIHYRPLDSYDVLVFMRVLLYMCIYIYTYPKTFPIIEWIFLQ